jgi:hypothetical protein
MQACLCRAGAELLRKMAGIFTSVPGSTYIVKHMLNIWRKLDFICSWLSTDKYFRSDSSTFEVW